MSGEFFSVLGTRPVIGRALTREDERTPEHPVAVLSYEFWQRELTATQPKPNWRRDVRRWQRRDEGLRHPNRIAP